MRLTVHVPSEIVLDVEGVSSLIAEGAEGAFGILPRHIDYVSALVPGILSFEAPGEGEVLVAVDRGVLVKCGAHVRVSVREAIRGHDLGTLRQAVDARFRMLDERELQARSALATLEGRFIHRFIEEFARARG